MAGARRAAGGTTGVAVTVGGPRVVLPASLVARVARAVVAGERRRALASLSFTFLGRDAMRRLNARWKGHDVPTDVIAFALDAPGGTAGDVYLCPWVAERSARAAGVSPREELIRLVIHGTLHVLGYDHPEDDRRTRSPMWRRQERYVAELA